MLDHFYPIQSDGWRFRDGTRPLYEWMLESSDRAGTFLNIGAGPTPPEERRRIRGRVARVVGVDPDPIVLTNADLDEAIVNDGVALPFDDSTFHEAYSDWTLEHVEDPVGVLSEVRRVLKPGGRFWFRTPNRFHYVHLVAAATPHQFHVAVANRARRLSVGAHEPWPTRYRVNSRRALLDALRQSGFSDVELRMVESHPSYLMFSAPAFVLGVAYERMVNRFDSLAGLREIIVGCARR